MPSFDFTISTPAEDFVDITDQVRSAVSLSGVQDGLCLVYCPHTTAGITINENADPDVVRDMLFGLSQTFPHRAEYRHFEGNTTAHLKASAMGSSQTLIIEHGSLILGRWQAVYLCEFDGPRQRRVFVKVIAG